MSENNDFEFSIKGFGDNEDIPEPTNKSTTNPEEILKKMMSGEENPFSFLTGKNNAGLNIGLPEGMENDFGDLMTLLLQDKNMLPTIFNAYMNGGNDKAIDTLEEYLTKNHVDFAKNHPNLFNVEEVESEVIDQFSQDLLDPTDFGSIECLSSSRIYEEFNEKYPNPIDALNDKTGVQKFFLSDYSRQLPLNQIKELQYVMSNNRFILYYTVMPEDYCGFFLAFIKYKSGEFAGVIADFANTFAIFKENGVAQLFNYKEDKEFFETDSNGNTHFENISHSMACFAIEYLLAPMKKTLFTPSEFGTIKNIMPSISTDSDTLQIGYITPSESAESNLFLKDSEMTSESNKYPFCLHFSHPVSTDTLNTLGRVLYKTNLNECALMKQLDIHFVSEKYFYVDVPLLDDLI